MEDKKWSWFVASALVLVSIVSSNTYMANAADCVGATKGEISTLHLGDKTTAELVAQFYSSREDSKRRRSEFRNTMNSRKLSPDEEYQAFKILLAKEDAVINEIKAALISRPAFERLSYLRGLTRNAFIKHLDILDSLFGLKIKEMDDTLKAELEPNGTPAKSKRSEKYGDEEIWYAPGGGQQSSWGDLLEAVDEMNLKSGELVSDLGSGIGRLGLLIGLMRPDVSFVGLEIVDERVKYATQAATELGFSNVKYYTANLSDPLLDLPQADHFYMYNPTNRRTSEIVTEKLVKLSESKKFRVYLLSYLQSASFGTFFKQVKEKNLRVYERAVP